MLLSNSELLCRLLYTLNDKSEVVRLCDFSQKFDLGHDDWKERLSKSDV